MKKNFKKNCQSGPQKTALGETGQTLIETLVAVFMLVMGVTAAVGLAIYAFNTSSGITRQIIATGLAREGLEAVKNMRDTNWLLDTLATNCYDFQNPSANDGKCYASWLNPAGGFNITPQSLRLSLDGSGSALWKVQSAGNNWGLDFDPSLGAGLGCGANFCGFYGVNNLSAGSADGSSEYYRQIVITADTSPPFNQPNLQRLRVESRVWWTDKKCPRSQSWPGAGQCSVSIQSNLTNWKTY